MREFGYWRISTVFGKLVGSREDLICVYASTYSPRLAFDVQAYDQRYPAADPAKGWSDGEDRFEGRWQTIFVSRCVLSIWSIES